LAQFIIRRIFLGIIVIFGVILITFVVSRLLPSDPAAQWAGPRATSEQIESARQELGLDEPLPLQFKIYLEGLLEGDLGYSLRTQQPIMRDLQRRLPPTVELVAVGTVMSLLIGIPLGVISATRKNRWPDHLSRMTSIGFVSVPTFWMALLLQLIFFQQLDLLPMGGQLSLEITIFEEVPHVTGFLLLDSLITWNMPIFWDALKHIFLPALAIAAFPVGLISRMTRSALLEILNEDYIKAARSYGLSERVVVWSYALRNSLGVIVPVIALTMGFNLMNTFLVESVFTWPGIGNYVSDAVITLDYPAIMGVTIFAAIAYVILNLIADIIISLDPRVRV